MRIRTESIRKFMGSDPINFSMALAAATVRGLILTVSHQEQIGILYPQVQETLVWGTCRELFA